MKKNASEEDNDFNFRDKRVDRALQRQGYVDADIFYSPIQGWLFWSSVMVIGGLYMVLPLLWTVWPLVPSLLLLSYLFNGYRNNNFALTADRLIIVNPNFPFRKITSVDLSDIELVTIDRDNLSWVASLIVLAFGNNYVDVKTTNGTKRYYCAYLQQWDAHSRNLTEKSLDDFDKSLRKKGISTVFNPDVD